MMLLGTSFSISASSIRGILQARILEWVAMPLSIFQGIDPECHNHSMWVGVMSPAMNMM